MGKVIVKAKIRNYDDEALLRRGFIQPEEIRQVETEGLVDTDATSLVLPKKIVDELGLAIMGDTTVEYADGRKEKRNIAGVVSITIGNRTVPTYCVVEENGDQVLIGQIVLEGMDLHVDPRGQKLVPRPGHEDLPLMEIYSSKQFLFPTD